MANIVQGYEEEGAHICRARNACPRGRGERDEDGWLTGNTARAGKRRKCQRKRLRPGSAWIDSRRDSTSNTCRTSQPSKCIRPFFHCPR